VLSSLFFIVAIRVTNSNCSEDQMRTYKVNRRPHYDVDVTIAVTESYWKQLLQFISSERCREL